MTPMTAQPPMMPLVRLAAENDVPLSCSILTRLYRPDVKLTAVPRLRTRLPMVSVVVASAPAPLATTNWDWPRAKVAVPMRSEEAFWARPRSSR